MYIDISISICLSLSIYIYIYICTHSTFADASTNTGVWEINTPFARAFALQHISINCHPAPDGVFFEPRAFCSGGLVLSQTPVAELGSNQSPTNPHRFVFITIIRITIKYIYIYILLYNDIYIYIYIHIVLILGYASIVLYSIFVSLLLLSLLSSLSLPYIRKQSQRRLGYNHPGYDHL